jgi:hypothetical protein
MGWCKSSGGGIKKKIRPRYIEGAKNDGDWVSKTQGGLGFRDLVYFNKAFLAKQGWRLLKNPTSLAAQIIGAKYYPNSTVLEAIMGKRPSFACRGLLSACDVLKNGLIWWVGMVETFRFGMTNRFQSLFLFSLHGEVLMRRQGWWSSSTQIPSGGIPSWYMILFPKMKAALCQIPLSFMQADNSLIWRGTSHGEFLVKSTYHMEKEL